MVADVGRRPATVDEARELLGTPKRPRAATHDGCAARSRDSKVLDLTRLLPGPFATLLFADMGAEVLKVEDPNGGDYIRWMPPYYERRRGARATARRRRYFLGLNRNKRSLRLDLRSPTGRDVLLQAGRELRRRDRELPARA